MVYQKFKDLPTASRFVAVAAISMYHLCCYILNIFIYSHLLFYLFILLYFIFLFLGCSLQLVRFQFPDQGSNLGPLQWKCRVLTAGPPGDSLWSFF